MLLPNRDGVRCDMCGKEHKSKFTYYSYDCHKVTVDISKMETRREQVTDVDGSVIGYDVCEECHKRNQDRCLENQK